MPSEKEPRQARPRITAESQELIIAIMLVIRTPVSSLVPGPLVFEMLLLLLTAWRVFRNARGCVRVGSGFSGLFRVISGHCTSVCRGARC